MKIAAIFLISALLCPCASIAMPPDQCLRQISESIDNGDAQAFEKLIDADAILDQALDIFMAEAQKPENASKLAPMLALLFSQANTQGGQAIRNLLKSEARAFALNGVSSGAFAGKNFNASQPQGYLAPLFTNASLGRKEIRGIGEPVADENGWYMPFSIHDYGNDQDYNLIGRFQGSDNAPCLAGIENLDQIFYQIKKEAMPE